jgi:GNAT superfamily N-acetyltransferase
VGGEVGRRVSTERDVTIVRVVETELGGELEGQLRSLLLASFPGYPDRSYFKLPPHFRYLAAVDGSVVAQVGVELRVIRVGNAVVRTFGIVDLCVRESARSRGLGSRLLAQVTEYARDCQMDFVILFADNDRIYARNGWVRVDNPLSWVKINEHATIGLATNVIPHAMMVRPVSQSAWPDGPVDLLGHVF